MISNCLNNTAQWNNSLLGESCFSLLEI